MELLCWDFSTGEKVLIVGLEKFVEKWTCLFSLGGYDL